MKMTTRMEIIGVLSKNTIYKKDLQPHLVYGIHFNCKIRGMSIQWINAPLNLFYVVLILLGSIDEYCPMLKMGLRKTHLFKKSLRRLSLCVRGRLWLLVVNLSSCIVSRYRNNFLRINFHINYILHYYHYNLKTTY